MVANHVSTTANLLYAIEPDSGIQAYYGLKPDPVTGEKQTNIGRDARSVVIENVRGKEDAFSLDTTGFQFHKHTSKFNTFDNDEEIRGEYYSESLEVIKKLTGASRVKIFGHVIRHRCPGAVDSPTSRQPALLVHVDQTTGAAVNLVHKYLPADASKLLGGRFQVINLWRPIANPAIDWPLALCDYRSVDLRKDTFPMSIVDPEIVSEIMGIKYNENHKWNYLHGMTPEEVILIKCADSIHDGSAAIFTPHTSFGDPTTPEGTPFRQSIELRSLVFYD